MITTKQAAEILGVSQGRVIQLCERGQLVAERFGGVWAIEEESVRERANDATVEKYRRSK